MFYNSKKEIRQGVRQKSQKQYVIFAQIFKLENIMTNKEEIRVKMAEFFSGEISSWIDSQKGQTDGFEYGRSYVESMQRISSEVFQLSMGKNPKSKNQKNFKPLKE
jgi:hypothetical protein